MADDASDPEDPHPHDHDRHHDHDHDDPDVLGENPTTAEQLWVFTRIILATLLLLIGFALLVGIIFRLT